MGSLFYATFEMHDPEILSALLPSNANPQPLAVATNQLASLARRQYKEIVVAFRNFTKVDWFAVAGGARVPRLLDARR